MCSLPDELKEQERPGARPRNWAYWVARLGVPASRRRIVPLRQLEACADDDARRVLLRPIASYRRRR